MEAKNNNHLTLTQSINHDDLSLGNFHGFESLIIHSAIPEKTSTLKEVQPFPISHTSTSNLAHVETIVNNSLET